MSALPHRADATSIDGVYTAHIERLFWLLREKLPRVLAANRYFEEQTGLHNEAGRNNLVDAFSHLGTLVESAPGSTFEQQAQQITLLEDHLRRSMMEAFEQVLKLRIGRLGDLWYEYDALVPPAERSANLNTPTEADVERIRHRIDVLLDRGRASKRATSWDAWEEGTQALVDACQIALDLERRLERGIVRFQYVRRRESARAYLTAVITSAVALGIGVLLGYLVSA